jgi:hypothetical protein
MSAAQMPLRRTLGLFAAFLAPASISAQQLRSEGVDPACRCEIVLSRLVRLGAPDDTIAILPNSLAARDSRGRFYVTPILPEGSVAVFGADGRFARTIGRRGGGPGELSRTRYVAIGDGDSLLVYDSRQRLSLFAPDATFARSRAMAGGVSAFRMAAVQGGKVVLNNYSPAHRSLVVVDRDFSGTAEFGKSIAGSRAPEPDELQVRLAALDSGRFAAAQQSYRYLIQVWDTAGRLVRQFARDPDWFRRWTPEDLRTYGLGTARPYIVGLLADIPQRRLWLVARIPDRRWQDPPPIPASERGRERPIAPVPLTSLSRVYDTIVEVLDMDSGRVLITQRFDDVFAAFMGGGLLYRVEEDPDGLAFIEVWRTEIVRQP